MKLTSKQAIELLESAKGKTESDGWIYHSICVGNTAGTIPEDIPFRTEFIKNHTYTIYEKIINICDLMCTKKVTTVDKRLIDIMYRRGVYPCSQYHIKETYKLKEYFDGLLGYNLYDLFTEIKENL